MVTIVVLLAVAFMSKSARADDKFIDVSFGGYSKHIAATYKEFDGTDTRYNESHNLVGIEYRDYDSGYGIFTFNNSHYDQSVAVVRSYYFQPINYTEVIASIGVVTGYKNRRACIVGVGQLCTMASVGIQVGTDKLKGRITWYGTAFVLTGTWRF